MERQFHWQTVNLLNVTLEGRVKTQLFVLMNPSADGLGQIPVYERVSHPRHDQQEVEGTRHRRSFFLMARHTVVEGCDHAQSPLSLACISPSISFHKVIGGLDSSGLMIVSPSGWADRCGRVGQSLPYCGLLLPQTGVSRLGLSPLPESSAPGVGWWGSSCWAPCWPCLPSLLPSRTTPESRCPQRARTVLSGLATSSCPLRRRQAVQGAELLVSFRHEMTASRGPSAWRRCREGKSGSSADSPFGGSASRGSPCRPPSGGHYSSCRRRPARRTVRVSANLSRTWSSGSVSIDTAAWSAQGSDTWCTVSPVRQKPAPWTVWHRAIPHWAFPLLQGRS